MKCRLLASASLLALAIVSPELTWAAAPAPTENGSATTSLGEVIVTAERRSINLQKAPLAISVVDGQKIDQRGATEISQVIQNVPSVIIQNVTGGVSTQATTGGGGPPNIAIRGLGTDGPNKNSAVAVYEDGILMGGGGANFYDISRVEVLRGPQGTLYGRGATAGSVNIITNNPVDEFQLAGRLQYGNYDAINTQVVGNIPLGDKLALRVGVNSLRHDGYFNNGQSSNDEVNTRAKLLYRPTDDLSILVGGDYYRADRTVAGTVSLSPTSPDPTGWNTAERSGGRDRINYEKAYADVEWRLGDVTLSYLPAYQHNHSENYSYLFGRLSSNAPYDRTWTQELRLSGGFGSRLSWITGVFDYDNHYQYNFIVQLPADTGPTVVDRGLNVRQSSVALFGDAIYALTDSLRFTAGVRQNWDQIHHVEDNLTFGTPQAIDFKKDYSSFNWKARLEADITPRNMVYAMGSTGYRPGGAQADQSYAPEKVTSIEFGSKNRFNNWLTLNAAVFHYDYSGFQTPQAYGTFPNLQFTIVAVPAEFYGAEAELVVKPTPDDTLTLSPTYLHGRFTGDYAYTDPSTGIFSSIPTKGKVVPHQPAWSFNGSYEHRFRLSDGASITAAADVHYQDQQYTDFDLSLYNGSFNGGPNPVYVQKAYAVYNASVNYHSANGKYMVGLYGNNIGNQIYKITTNGQLNYIDDPRTYGIILSLKY